MLAKKIYTEKIPSVIRNAMREFTNEECLLIKRIKINGNESDNELNCHLNVSNYVKEKGGNPKYGWLLYRNRNLLNMGVWVWQFHSVCEISEGFLDITEDSNYKSNAFSTVWLDSYRKANLEEGYGYNNIIILENQKVVDKFNEAYQCNLEVGVTYWTTNCLRFFKKINEHSGKYLILSPEYKSNLNKLTVESEEAVNDNLKVELMFNYNVSAA